MLDPILIKMFFPYRQSQGCYGITVAGVEMTMGVVG